ncbi:MAG: hypothetical protein IT306_14945 [Chloroflexi bacterium]|nr:hypothetical protein [Chloroflexota bacterium]
MAFCLVALLLLLIGNTPLPAELRVRQLAAPLAFPLVDWHLARLAERGDRIGLGLLGAHPVPGPADRAAVAAYFAARPSDRQPLAVPAERAFERAVSDVLWQEGLTTAAPWSGSGQILFPPVAFTFTAPPEVLIVSRRDRVSVVQSELLRPGVSVADAERLEAATDDLGYSSLVVEIGGLATYPTMVLQNTRPLDAAVAVAHEWIHGYLFFTPLGRRYWSSQDARTINETAAEMVSRELGPRIARSLDLESPAARPPDQPSGAQPSLLQFRSLMRETRITLDRLLRAGQIDEAEAYLRDRRQDFLTAGFQIRKLNQAYFAFYGSYGDAAAGVNPIPRQLGWLRAASGSPGEFLRRVGQITSAEELARAVGE